MNKLKSKLNQINDELNRQLDPDDQMGSLKKPTQNDYNAAQDYDNGSRYGPGQWYGQPNSYSHQPAQAYPPQQSGPNNDYSHPPGPLPSYPGPPPGSSGPPNGHDVVYGYPSHSNSAFAPPYGQYASPPTQQQLYGHTSDQGFPIMSHPAGNTGSAHLNFPPRFTIWTHMDNNTGETYLGIGANKNDDLWHAKWPMSGKLAIKQGSPENKGGAEIGLAKNVGLSGSSMAITMPNGFSCDFKKGSSLSSSGKGYHFSMDVEGARQQTFVWKVKSGGLVGKLMGGGGTYSLYRQGDPEAPLATYVTTNDMGMSSKSELGQFEFVGEGATGSLGDNFTKLAVITMLKIIQQETDMKILKAVLRGF